MKSEWDSVIVRENFKAIGVAITTKGGARKWQWSDTHLPPIITHIITFVTLY